MSCIKVVTPAGLPSADSSRMESSINQFDAESKYRELITSANKVFGKEWSHAVTNTTIDFIDCNSGKYHVGCQSTIKVQLSNGRYHEDVGYSNVDASTKGLAVEKARSISITRALARALSCFPEMEAEMRPTISQQSLIPNISNIPKTKFAPKRPKTPPPPAHSTPKVPRSPANFDRMHAKEPLIPVAPVTNNGKKVPEANDKRIVAADSVEIVDVDFNFDDNGDDVLSPNVPTTDSTASTSTTMTSEEIRLDRKRKQKEKQEEFKRQMKEKEERERKEMQNHRQDAQKPSSKF